ncbi:MAG: flagellar basal body P-ring formation protein FlgA [Bdellovibrionales bacterium]|nr:flagellar basal body P-ring formation protein FlgA [Bdellovibrionales bacterium]
MIKILLIISSFLMSSLVWASPSIEVKRLTVISGDGQLKLSHIVKTKDLGASLSEKIKEVELGNAPKVGEKRIYSAGALAEILRQLVNETGSSNVKLSIPSRIVIENRGNIFDQDRVEIQLRQRWQAVCGQCKFEGLVLRMPHVDKEDLGSEWKLEMDPQLPKQTFNYKVRFKNSRNRSYWLTGQVQVLKKVMVTKKAIGYQEPIQPEDIGFEYRDITFSNDSSAELKDLTSVAARRALSVGEVVWHNTLVREKKVRRGDLIRAILTEGGWKIGMTGVAQEDGYVGKVIKIKSTQTDKTLVGRVNDEGEVEVQ